MRKVSYSVESLTIINTGTTAATINANSLTTAPAYMNIISNGCTGSVLSINSPGNTCIVVVQLGPTPSSVVLSGTAVYAVTYSGGQANNITVLNDIPYTIQSNQQSVSIESITAVNSSSGDGVLGTDFIFNGWNSADAQSIIVTYVNSGTNPIQFTGINNTNNPINWTIDSTSSTCYNGGILPSSILATGQTCSLKFNNQLFLNSVALIGGLGASYQKTA